MWNSLAGARFDGSDDFMSATFTLNHRYRVFIAFVKHRSENDARIVDAVTGNNPVMIANTSQDLWAHAGNWPYSAHAMATNGIAYLALALFNSSSSECETNNNTYVTADLGANNLGERRAGVPRRRRVLCAD